MSLIEQAAKRLEELRRSGADVGVDPAPVTEPTVESVPDVVPTPEALMRALESRNEPLLKSAPRDASSAPRGQPHAAAAERIARRPRVQPLTTRQATIDLERLKMRGYVTPDAPQTQIADEFRVVKRPIIQNAIGKNGTHGVRNGNLVMITSALPGEGKTFTAVNLAMSIAMEFDNTVLLIDGDVAHPALPGLLGVPESPGLLDLLIKEDLDVADALVKTNVEKLSVIPAGTPHRRATELLASEQMAHLLKEIASRYSDRIVLFDSPPLLATTEARVLASHMGQIVMVVAAETTSHSALTQALSTIESCEVVMMMLNKARQTDVGAYYGYYAAADVAR
jgi:exopolysaccharide/PEP-CTERM locus tyrosine autokinase